MDLGTPKPVEDVAAQLLAGGPPRPLLNRVLQELSRVDHAAYEAVAGTDTPTLDKPLRLLSNAANHSVLWLAASALLATAGGRRGRRAALAGTISVAVSSAVVTAGLKRLHDRERPDREAARVVEPRQTPMPSSSSFPSGHSASGFAFATAVGHQIPPLALPLRMLAGAVAYSRVHTGVHYPGDAIVGSLAGGSIGLMVGSSVDRFATPRS